MPARKVVRQATRYEIDASDLAETLGIPAELEIVSITFHNAVLRIFTVTKEDITELGQNQESCSDDKGKP